MKKTQPFGHSNLQKEDIKNCFSFSISMLGIVDLIDTEEKEIIFKMKTGATERVLGDVNVHSTLVVRD